MMAELSYLDCHFVTARKWYDMAIAVEKSRKELYLGKGKCLASENKHELAVKQFDIAIKIDRSCCESWYLRGDSLQRQRKSKLAE
jgi:tetratricopeptide (TPR) repeat protein